MTARCMWVNRQRGRERERWKIWQSDCMLASCFVLAWHQQPDGQLAISSGQVEAYESAISHTLPSLFCSILCSFSLKLVLLLLKWPPTLLHVSLRAQPLCRGLQKPDGIHSCVSVCFCMFVCACSFPDNQPPAHQSCGASLELLALIKTCWNVPGISRERSTHTPCSHHDSSSKVFTLACSDIQWLLLRRMRSHGTFFLHFFIFILFKKIYIIV